MSSSKRCTKCGIEKPLDNFYRAKGMRDGRRSDCKSCNLAAKQERYRRNPRPYIERTKRWQQENREHYMRNQRAWREANAEQWKRQNRERHLQRKYGITQADYDAMLEAQGGGCAICGEPPSEEVALHVDHDHRTGEVRGLLCVNCNNGLGQFRECLERLRGAVRYLEAWERLSGEPNPAV